MRGHESVFGQYVNHDSPLHRLAYGSKLVILAAIGALCYLLPALWPPGWLPILVLLGCIVLGFRVAKLPLRYLLSPLRVLWPIAIFLGGYHLYAGGIFQGRFDGTGQAITVIGIMAVCVYTATLLTLTTSINEVLDGLTRLTSPLRRFGVDPERFALTVSIVFRSIPYILGAYADVHEAAKARGMPRSIRAHAVPTVIATVALAEATGEALKARGLGDTDARR